MFFVLGTVSGQTITNCVSVKKGLKKYEKVLKPCNNILPYICVGNIVKAKEGNIVLPNSY